MPVQRPDGLLGDFDTPRRSYHLLSALATALPAGSRRLAQGVLERRGAAFALRQAVGYDNIGQCQYRGIELDLVCGVGADGRDVGSP